ncbi:MAG: hypothetical protein DRP12_02465 [Candidatus Aenigmatarchaeota archaeon]|nr:MAG: hypothetical protein DRP12_02465 [Candidatus Aenigmarchaeota archaeon]
MGVISGLGKFFGGILLTLGLAAFLSLYAATWLTTYDNLAPIVTEFISPNISQEQLDSLYNYILYQCNRSQEVVVPVGDVNVTLNCSEIPEKEVIPQLLVQESFKHVYYKTYPCDFLTCIKTLKGQELVMFLVSAQANSFFRQVKLYSLIAAVLGAGLLIVSIRRWKGITRSLGSSFLIISISYLLFSFSPSLLPVPPEASQLASIITSKLFQVLSPYVWGLLIAGIILLVLSLIPTKKEKEEEAWKAEEEEEEALEEEVEEELEE